MIPRCTARLTRLYQLEQTTCQIVHHSCYSTSTVTDHAPVDALKGTTERKDTLTQGDMAGGDKVHLPRKKGLVELSNLSESTSKLAFNSLPFASPSHVIFPASSPLNASYNTPLFSLRAFPAVPRVAKRRSSDLRSTIDDKEEDLDKLTSRSMPPRSLHHATAPTTFPMLTKDEMRERLIGLKRFRGPYRLDCTILAGKKKVHKSAVIRNRCRCRLREAIRMVVVRGGAASEDVSGEDRSTLVFDQDQEGHSKWLVRGYSYVFSVTLEMYLHPFPSLVNHVRLALSSVKSRAEKALYEDALAMIPALPPDQQRQQDLTDDFSSTRSDGQR